MSERLFQWPEAFDEQVEQALRIAVLPGLIDRSDPRVSSPGSGGPNFLCSRRHHFFRQSTSILLRTALAISPIVDAVAKELLEQVSIRALDFDPVAIGVRRVMRRSPVLSGRIQRIT